VTNAERTKREASSLTESELQRFLERNPGLIHSPAGAEFSPLVCIGRDVKTDDGTIDCFFVSPSGSVVVVVSDISAFQLTAYVDRLRGWGVDELDAVAADYFFHARGQAYRVIDIMAALGHLTFSDESDFISRVEDGLESGALLVVAVGDSIKTQAAAIREYLLNCGSPAFNIVFTEQ